MFSFHIQIYQNAELKGYGTVIFNEADYFHASSIDVTVHLFVDQTKKMMNEFGLTEPMQNHEKAVAQAHRMIQHVLNKELGSSHGCGVNVNAEKHLIVSNDKSRHAFIDTFYSMKTKFVKTSESGYRQQEVPFEDDLDTIAKKFDIV